MFSPTNTLSTACLSKLSGLWFIYSETERTHISVKVSTIQPVKNFCGWAAPPTGRWSVGWSFFQNKEKVVLQTKNMILIIKRPWGGEKKRMQKQNRIGNRKAGQEKNTQQSMTWSRKRSHSKHNSKLKEWKGTERTAQNEENIGSKPRFFFNSLMIAISVFK